MHTLDRVNNFEFDGKLSIRVENAAGKGEIAQYERFLLFFQCFQKTCTAGTLQNKHLFG